MIIRDENPDDFEAVRRINNRAFGESPSQQTLEAKLVEQLRADGDVLLSLLAVAARQAVRQPVGHIPFSRLVVELSDHTTRRGAALAPMAVLPGYKRRGIGSALVREGLARCREMGVQVICVLGHPAYYPRFGFSRELGRAIESPYAGEAFMALKLKPGALRPRRGRALYARAFRALADTTA